MCIFSVIEGKYFYFEVEVSSAVIERGELLRNTHAHAHALMETQAKKQRSVCSDLRPVPFSEAACLFGLESKTTHKSEKHSAFRFGGKEKKRDV